MEISDFIDKIKKDLDDLSREVAQQLEQKEKEDEFFDLSVLRSDIFDDAEAVAAGFNEGRLFFQIRKGGKYKNKAFYLSGGVNWRIERDDQELLCLVPRKKIGE